MGKLLKCIKLTDRSGPTAFNEWQKLAEDFLHQDGTDLTEVPFSQSRAKEAATKLNDAISTKRLGMIYNTYLIM
jgi:hypothetical protein